MTVTDTENTNAPAAENTEPERKVIPAEELPELLKLVLQQISAQHAKASELSKRVNAASGDGIGELLSELRENSTNPEVVALRDKVARAHEVILAATNKMDEILKPELNVPSEEEVETFKSELKDLTKQIKVGSDMFDYTAKSQGVEADITDYLKPLPGMRKSSGKVATEGLRRPRVKTVEVAKGANSTNFTKVAGEDGKSTFSHLVKYFKDNTKESVPTTELHKAWFTANGTEDFDAIPEVSTFVYSVNGESYTVRITK
jgi:hypothetical protein